jgi:predicted glycosyltransferase
VSRTAPRVLVYSQDGLGLGHLRRTSSLIAGLLAAQPEAGVLSVSDSPLGKFFATAGHHDYLKLPSIRKSGPGDWHAVSLPVPFPEVLDLRRDLLRRTAIGFAPDLLLVDHMPHGAMGELVPTLEALRDRSVKVVLGLRDILDAPHVVRRRWTVEGAYDAVAEHYDEVLVYGSRDVFDVGVQYGWPADAARRLRYCGYVCPPEAGVVDGSRLRTRYLGGHRDTRLVLATAGGGADAYPLFRALVDAAPAIGQQHRCRIVVITGPFMPDAEQQDLRRRARKHAIPVHRSVRNSLEHLAAADLVVSMAGYNTTTEILRLGRPCLLVPRKGPSAEQRMRAQLFSERGWVRWLRPEDLGPEPVADAVGAALDEAGGVPGPRRFPAPELDGQQRAVRQVLRLLDQAEGYPATAGSVRS